MYPHYTRCQSWIGLRHRQPVRDATLALTISPRSDRLGRVAREERGRVMTLPFGFSFLSGNCVVVG